MRVSLFPLPLPSFPSPKLVSDKQNQLLETVSASSLFKGEERNGIQKPVCVSLARLALLPLPFCVQGLPLDDSTLILSAHHQNFIAPTHSSSACHA